jgi:4a-hydroxytetrahydrobiopterin dehydratase
MMTLAERECVPCAAGASPLKGEALANLAGELKGGWQIVNEHHLEKEFRFANFRKALEFVNRVGELAEAQGHHPDLHLSWGRARVSIWTHKIDGLTGSDFVLAARIDQIEGG